MPKLIASIDGVVVKEVQLTKDRTTLGRRPYNDVVLDNLAVSGEHAAIQMKSGVATLEDLGSTNGTYVNGKPIRKQALVHDDLIELGRYKIKFFDVTGATVPGSLGPAARAASAGQATSNFSSAPTVPAAPPIMNGRVRVLSGSAAGREMALTKNVTTIGKPGVCVALLERRLDAYVLVHKEGDNPATVNGVPVGAEPVRLKNHDRISLGGIQLEFLD
ncbi:MAG: FHA domain-containing protein [Ottowia sp.]|nr:FHA domain-containing protein [Ottowia sp.]